MTRRKLVVIGMLGNSLDGATGPGRWERWRPTVALCSHDDLLIDRFELLVQPEHQKIADVLVSDLNDVSPETEVRQHPLTLRDPWDFEEVYGALHDFVRTYSFNPEQEDYLAHITTGTHVVQICLFLLTESRALPARLLQSSPGKGQYGPGTYSIIDLDLSKYDRLAARFVREQRDAQSFLKAGIETKNTRFNQTIEQIERIAVASKAPILLLGPTGAGKSQLARKIYELRKTRRLVAGPLVEVNCATLRGDQSMAALFGHTKGAFTGALQERPGFLRKADGGMLFLDEIGELGLDEQATLLAAIEQKSFYPVGSDKLVHSNFLLIAGTNRELRSRVDEGKFREDLLARINLWTYKLPGLAERIEDIEPNLVHELERTSDELGTRITMSREARSIFLNFAKSPKAIWRGNFRDFNASIMRMATLADGGRITETIVLDELERLQSDWRPTSAISVTTLDNENQPALSCVKKVLGESATDEIDRFDSAQLEAVLQVCKHTRSMSEAGRELFAASRKQRSSLNDSDRLRKYLSRWSLDFSEVHRRLNS